LRRGRSGSERLCRAGEPLSGMGQLRPSRPVDRRARTPAGAKPQLSVSRHRAAGLVGPAARAVVSQATAFAGARQCRTRVATVPPGAAGGRKADGRHLAAVLPLGHGRQRARPRRGHRVRAVGLLRRDIAATTGRVELVSCHALLESGGLRPMAGGESESASPGGGSRPGLHAGRAEAVRSLGVACERRSRGCGRVAGQAGGRNRPRPTQRYRPLPLPFILARPVAGTPAHGAGARPEIGGDRPGAGQRRSGDLLPRRLFPRPR
jgi:hypothetical protein